MRKIDHIRKVVYIIVGILTIISLVFTLYKKIGKASSDVNSPIIFSPPPYLFGNNIGSSYLFDNSLFSSIISDVITRRGDNYHDETIIIVPYSNELFVNVINRDNFPLSSVVENGATLFSYSYCGVYSYSGTFLRQYFSGNIGIRLNDIFETLDNRDYYKLNTSVDGYPVFVYSYSNLVVTDTNLPFFSPFPQDIVVGGHSKGGVLANYQSSFDLLEDSSDVPKVDTTSPADSSSVPAWLGKILNGLGVIGNSIQSGVLTIGDYIGTLGESIGEFFNSVGEKIDAIKDSIDSFFAWVTEPPNNETILSNIQPYLESNTMIQGFISSKNAIQGVYSDITGVSAKSSSQMKWIIPFNLPGLSNNFTATIDFGWYENIRSIVQPILIMIISVSFILSLIRSIPGILHGNSPEGDT